ncbi:MAG: hypothetical protein ACUVWN_08850 [bacterium]
MRLRINPRPDVTVRPEIRIVRPPDEFIDILSKSESELRQYINDIESSQTFKKVVEKGYVKKVGFKGRVPNHIYQEFRDKEFIEFLKKYNITDIVGWESDFFDKKAMRKVKDISAKYKVPRGELVRALDYCRFLRLSWDGMEQESFISSFSIDDPESIRQFEDKHTDYQSDDLISKLAELLERNSISEEDFTKNFLSGNQDPYEIARELNISLDIIDDIIETLEKVQIMNCMQVNVIEHYEKTYGAEIRPSAIIKRFNNPPRAEIQIDTDEYSFRYSIKEPDETTDKEEHLLLDKLRMINQRKTLVFRIISFIYQYQYPYFVSLNPIYLKPLSQSQIAKEMGEHESTISRILRKKYIDTDTGVFPLKFFCQSKEVVIKRIIDIIEPSELKSGRRKEPFSDAEIADILKNEYDVNISRRTVTYYRNKIKNSPKFYLRRKIKK